MEIRGATNADLAEVTRLLLMLFDDNTYDELQQENAQIIASDSEIILMASDAGQNIGIAHCAIRRDYVEGTDGGPVGYLEAIYVLPEHRKKGVARKLVSACEFWAKRQGCRQFASDCLLENQDSYRFHLAIGFAEANRIICFTKQL